MQAFADLVRAGKALYIGVSEWPIEQIRAAAELARGLGIQIVADQVQYSMLWRAPEKALAPTCAELGIGLVAWSPLAQGILTGKYQPAAVPPPNSRARDENGGANLIGRWLHDDVLTAVQELRAVADDAALSLPHLALAWVLSRPNVSQVVVGGSTPEQISENARAAGRGLPEGAEARIDQILAGIGPREASTGART